MAGYIYTEGWIENEEEKKVIERILAESRVRIEPVRDVKWKCDQSLPSKGSYFNGKSLNV